MKIKAFVFVFVGFAFLNGVNAQEKTGPLQMDEPTRTYLLGPDDQITVRVVDAEEITDKPLRISTSGFITLPMIGRVRAAGLTVEQLESDITDRLRKYIKEPEVSVTRDGMRSQPVSVLGSVRAPGVHQLQGHKTLLEIISMAGGMTEEAGPSAKITRRKEWGPIPLPDAVDDPTGEFSTADVPLRELLQGKNPAANILIMPNDVISVPKGEMVYVIGEVGRPGGIVLGGQHNVTVLQALSLASGPQRTAKTDGAKLLRVDPSSAKRTEIPVDLKLLLASKIDDIPMQPDDILFVPGAKNRALGIQLLQSLVQTSSTIAVLATQ
jgi:polysaccharide biosynthesis/export protein